MVQHRDLSTPSHTYQERRGCNQVRPLSAKPATMIPWAKFRSDKEPSYSDHVYHPTRRLLAEKVLSFPHQSSLMNAPPLLNADDRRFVISQWPPDQRARHFSSFHADHISGIEAAIDTLVGYYDRHELKPLSAYDHDGWPAGDDNKNDIGSDDLSESEPEFEAVYDFPSSLAGLTLDSADGLFGSKDFFNSAGHAPELSLSPSSTDPPSPSQRPQHEGLGGSAQQTSESSAKIHQRTSTPPSLTICPTATTQSSLPPPLTSTTNAASHPTLSIADLIHPNASPDAISASSTGGPDPSDPETIKLLTTSNANLLATAFFSAGIPMPSNQQSEPVVPASPTAERQQTTRNQVDAIRQGILPVPLRGSRTYKALRMRRNSRERAENRSRRGSGAEAEKAQAKLAAEVTRSQAWAAHQRPNSSSSSGEVTVRFQPYSYEYGGIDWSQPLERASTVSTSIYTANNLAGEEHDKYAAHQLPTSAIKYEPLDDPKLVPHYQQDQHQRGALKRKERDDDNAHPSPSSRPRLAPSACANTRASHWPAIHYPHDPGRY